MIETIGTAGLCCLITLVLERQRLPRAAVQILAGLAFGLGAAVSMLTPFLLPHDLLLDLRALFIGLVTGLVGPLAGAIALLLACVTRVVIGGATAGAGLAALTLTFAFALIWRHILRDRLGRDDLHGIALSTLSLTMSVSLLLLLPFFPDQLRSIFATPFPYLVVGGHLAGTLGLGSLLLSARRILDDQRQLARLANTDPLTGLLNRRGLISRYGKWQANTTGEQDGLFALADIDEFKAINETFGHEIGDACLQRAGAALAAILPNNGLVARIGGDEFVIAALSLPRETADALTHRLNEGLSLFITHPRSGDKIIFSLSFGIHQTRADGVLADILRAADERMLAVKRERRFSQYHRAGAAQATPITTPQIQGPPPAKIYKTQPVATAAPAVTPLAAKGGRSASKFRPTGTPRNPELA